MGVGVVDGIEMLMDMGDGTALDVVRGSDRVWWEDVDELQECASSTIIGVSETILLSRQFHGVPWRGGLLWWGGHLFVKIDRDVVEVMW